MFEIIAPVELAEVLIAIVIVLLMVFMLNPPKVGGDRQ
jgi:hypothetical protein